MGYLVSFNSMLQNKRIALLLALTLALLAHACTAVKLRVQNVECIHEEIAEPDSLVTIVLVAGDYDDEPVYFDFVVRTCPCESMLTC